MSALQKQLASIASSATHELDLKAQKSAHSKSLLFEPSVAANQPLDILYQICVEGFEELCAIDVRFSRFGKTIFSPQSRTEDRVQMNASKNEELDFVLESFLSLVGGRLLLMPALKTVEWLVRRFRIHEYNTVQLVLTFLPYHAMPVFPSLLSILPKQLPPTLKFLHPYMNSLSNPPRSVIAYTSTHNLGFFQALNDYTLAVSKVRSHHVALISLWASVMARAVDGKINASRSGRQSINLQREEEFLIQLLPVLNTALSIKHAPELLLGCYMIVVILVTKSNLDDQTISALMVSVAKSLMSDSAEAGLGCLATIAEQKEDPELPRAVTTAVSKLPRLAERLKLLSINQNIRNLSLGIVKDCLDTSLRGSNPDGADLIGRLIQQDVLNEEDKRHTIRNIEQVSSSGSFDEASASAVATQQQIAQSNEEPSQNPERTNTPTDVDLGSANEAMSDGGSDEDTFASAKIPKRTWTVSFLTNKRDPLFDELLSFFERACSGAVKIKRFFELDIWHSDGSFNDLLATSFLIRVWCTGASSKVKSMALRQVMKRINDLVDCSAVKNLAVLYAVLALVDSSNTVRREAATTILALMNQNAQAGEKDYWIERQVYGDPIDKSNLSNEKASLLTSKCVLPRIEECIADRNHLSSAFEAAMKGSTAQTGAKEKETGKRLRSTERESIFIWMVQHAQQTPIMTAKHRLLRLLNGIDKINGQTTFAYTGPILRQWLSSTNEDIETCKRESLDTMELNRGHVGVVHANDEEAQDLLLSSAEGGENIQNVELLQALYERLRNLWSHLKEPRQIKIFKALLRSAVLPQKGRFRETIRIESKAVLGGVSVAAGVLSGVVQDLLKGMDSSSSSAPKRRRTESGFASTPGDLSSVTQQTLVMMSLVLEIADSAQHDFNLKWFHTLFLVLRQIQEYASRHASDLGYLQSLTLSILASQTRNISNESLSPSFDSAIVRIDTLVECIRNTSYMQARQSALLILSRLARIMPQTVLQSIIPVFTLMSASTMKQSDEFSIYVVDQTIQEVIPLLAQTLRSQNEDLVCATAEILVSFAAAFRHVPRERRVRLFGLLATSLGPTETLHAILAALVDGYPGDAEVMQFTVLLLNQFNALESLTALSRYFDFIIHDTPASKAIIRRSRDREGRKSAKTNLSSAVPRLITDGIGASKLKASYNQTPVDREIRIVFGQLMKQILQASGTESEYSPPRDLCTKILRCTLQLLPLDEFLISVGPLISTDHSQDIFQSVLKVTELQLKSAKDSGKKPRQAAMSSLSSLTTLLEDIDDDFLKPPTIVCIDTIIEKFGKYDIGAVFKAVQVVSSVCFGGAGRHLKSVALHCIASSIEVLRNEIIPLLQPTLKIAHDNLRETLDDRDRTLQHYDAAYAVVISLLDQLPYMFPQEKLLYFMELSAQATKIYPTTDAGDSRSQFWQVVATRIDINVVFGSVGKVWQTAIVEGPLALEEYANLLHRSIENNGKSAISKHARSLLEAFFTFFDVRRSVDAGGDSKDATKSFAKSSSTQMLETKVIDSMVALVLKISDTVFRPFFVRLVDWATSSLPKHDTEGQMLRSMTLFRFSTALSERLRWLVTPYFNNLLEPAASILTAPREDSVRSTTKPKSKRKSAGTPSPDKQDELTSFVLTSIVSSLRHVTTAQQDLDNKTSSPDPDLFKRDAAEFYLSSARFQQLLPALLAPLSSYFPSSSERPTPSLNLSNTKPSGKASPPSISTTILSQTLIALTLLASTQRSQPAHLTQLTKSLLELCKHDDAPIRLNAVKAFRVLTEGTDAVIDPHSMSSVEPEEVVKGVQGVSFEDREEWLARELPAMLPVIAGLREDDDEGVERETGAWVRGMEGVLGQRLGELLE